MVLLALTSCKKNGSSSNGDDSVSTGVVGTDGPHESTDRSITVNWEDFIPDAENVVGYYLVYSEGETAPADCQADNRIVTNDPSDTTVTISGLQPDTFYTFRICAFDSNGDMFTSDDSVFSYQTLAEGSSPGNQYISAISDLSQSVISVEGNPKDSTVGLTCGENGSAKILKKSDDQTIVDLTSVIGGEVTNLTISASILQSVLSSDGLVPISIYCCDPSGENCALDSTKSITLDSTGPGDVTGFTASTGTAENSIDLIIDLPTDVSEYGSVKIYRSAADEGSAPDCGSGTLVDTTTNFATDPYNRTIISLTGGATYHFTACVHDAYDNITTVAIQPSALAQPPIAHYMFVTSVTDDGDIGGGGIASMDSICDSEGDAGLIAGKTWKAFISSDGPLQDAADYVSAMGRVFLVDGANKIADSAADLFDGTIDSKLNKQADGTVVSDSTEYWTGSLTDGTSRLESCSGWTDDAGQEDGAYGEVGLTDATWINASGNGSCTQNRRWLCISID